MPKQRKSKKNVNRNNSKIPKTNVDENVIKIEEKDADEIDTKNSEIEVFADRNQEIFYKLTADTVFRLSDKRIIRINKGMFYIRANSDAIFQMLFSPAENNVIEIVDIDSVTFKLFLDCIMGFIPYTLDNALIIFRAVWKYQIGNSIQDCINVLEPKTMNEESLCNCLNIAVSCECDVLVTKIIDYIYYVYNPYKLLNNETCCFLLKPSSLVEILKTINYLDFITMEAVIKWGRNYLKEKKIDMTLKELFQVFNIVEYFEKSLNLFGVPHGENYFLGCNNFLNDVFVGGNKSTTWFPFNNYFEFKKSEWKTINKGDSLAEEIVMDSIKCAKPANLLYTMGTNFVIYFDVPPKSKAEILFSADVIVNEGKAGAFNWFVPFDEKNGTQYLSKYTGAHLVVKCKNNNHSNHLITLKINYRFMSDCRILLMTRPNDLKKLYFTNDIILSRISY